MRQVFDRHGCDKGFRHGYERVYEPALQDIKNAAFRLLEIGILRGESLACWLEYFPRAQIVAIDTFERVRAEDIAILEHPRIEWHQHDSTQPLDLGHFDVAIDDGLHTFPAQRRTLENFKPCVAAYFIEDVWMLDQMTNLQRQHKWLQNEGYSDKEYADFMAALQPYDVKLHDLRQGHQPDSFIVEVL